jgi:hypothetical protein
VGVCGTWFRYTHNGAVEALPTHPEEIKVCMLSGNVLGHPTVMMRKAYLRRHGLYFDEAYRFAQDYEFWTRCYPHFGLANLGEVLLDYRTHPTQMSVTYGPRVEAEPRQIRLNQLRLLGIVPTEREARLHGSMVGPHPALPASELLDALRWLRKLKRANDRQGVYDRQYFNAWLLAIRQKLLRRFGRALVATAGRLPGRLFNRLR